MLFSTWTGKRWMPEPVTKSDKGAGEKMKADTKDKLEKSLLLYAVTDRHWLEGRTLEDVVRESLEGGVTFLQLREKDLDEESFFEEALKHLKEKCQ